MTPVLLAALGPQTVWACMACATGDPTLTVLGGPPPRAGAIRVSAETRVRRASFGPPTDTTRAEETAIEWGLAWAPSERLRLSASLPWQYRRLLYANLAEDRGQGLGDARLQARWFLWSSAKLARLQRLALLTGIELPTSPTLRDASGRPLSWEAQPGTGRVDPILGLSFQSAQEGWSLWTSATFIGAPAGRHGARPGPVALVTVAPQFQPRPWLALRLSADLRAEGATRVAGRSDPDSGGVASFLAPELVLGPADTLRIRLAVSIPTWAALRGRQNEQIAFRLGVAFES